MILKLVKPHRSSRNQNNPHTTSNCQCAACKSCFAWSLAQPAAITNWFIIACSFNVSILTKNNDNNKYLQHALPSAKVDHTKCVFAWRSRVTTWRHSTTNKLIGWLLYKRGMIWHNHSNRILKEGNSSRTKVTVKNTMFCTIFPEEFYNTDGSFP